MVSKEMKYKAETLHFNELKERMTVPSYQRPLVWSSSQKQNFIENISKGFPFGSLLLYKYENDTKYSLIDGQQRYTTLLDYEQNPGNYIQIDTPDSDIVDRLLDATGMTEQCDDSKDAIKRQLIEIITEMYNKKAQGEEVSNTYLADVIKEKFGWGKDIVDQLEIVRIQEVLMSQLDDHIDLRNLDIPVIFFKGDNSELAEVFANVNLGGTKLTKYQVFAAQWNRLEIKLSNAEYSDQILNKTIKRYNELTSERSGIQIENFSESDMLEKRTVTLPELCHALGEIILENCNALWPKDSKKNDNTVDTIGYHALGIVFGIHPQRLAGKGPESPSLLAAFEKAYINQDETKVEKLLACILGEFKEINSRFATHLRKVSNKSVEYETSRTTVLLQFLSFFAALWMQRYGKIESLDFTQKLKYQKNGYDDTCKNIFRCFVLDMLTNQWKGSGDSRLAAYIDGTLSYARTDSFTNAKFDSAVQQYLTEIESTPSLNIDGNAKTILTIVANTRREQYTKSKYDYEHLISKKALQSRADNGLPAYKAFMLPGGNIGNIAILEENKNRSKGSTNLYDSYEELGHFDGTREFVPNGKVLQEADRDLKDKRGASARAFMENRARSIMNVLTDILCSDE